KAGITPLDTSSIPLTPVEWPTRPPLRPSQDFANPDSAMNLLHEKKLPDIPGYDIREKIAEGGIGTVYKGVQLSTDQTVAIKIIAARASTCPKSRQRAEREFRSANRLVHPNIVQALDLIREESKLYLVMEYVDGLSLGEHVERHGPLT